MKAQILKLNRLEYVGAIDMRRTGTPMTDATPTEVELLRELEAVLRTLDIDEVDNCRFDLNAPSMRFVGEVLADLDAERAGDDIPAGATPLDPAMERVLTLCDEYEPAFSISLPGAHVRTSAIPCRRCGRVSSDHQDPGAHRILQDLTRVHNAEGPCAWCMDGDCPSMREATA
ncbi:MAG: hypothetical protein ACQGVC_18175 [Myxococcota bacterium]